MGQNRLVKEGVLWNTDITSTEAYEEGTPAECLGDDANQEVWRNAEKRGKSGVAAA